ACHRLHRARLGLELLPAHSKPIAGKPLPPQGSEALTQREKDQRGAAYFSLSARQSEVDMTARCRILYLRRTGAEFVLGPSQWPHAELLKGASAGKQTANMSRLRRPRKNKFLSLLN